MTVWRSLVLCVFVFAGCGGGAERAPEAPAEAAPDGQAPAETPPQEAPVSSEGDPGGARPISDWPGIVNPSHEGNIYFAGQPDSAGLRRAFQIGVEVVVNLRSPGEMSRLDFDEEAEVQGLGMRYVSIPITPDTFSEDDVTAFAEAMTDLPGPVLVHCASANRVGALWAAYLAIEKGVDLTQALERGRQAGLKSEALGEAVKRMSK